MVRLYGPKKPLFDKTWRLPDVEKLPRNKEPMSDIGP